MFWSQESPAVAVHLQPQPSLTEVHGKPGSCQVAGKWTGETEASAAHNWLQMAAWNKMDWNGLIEITYGSLFNKTRMQWSMLQITTILDTCTYSIYNSLVAIYGHASYRIPACFKYETKVPGVALCWEMRQEGHTTEAAKSWQKPGEVGNLNHSEMLRWSLRWDILRVFENIKIRGHTE